MITRRSFLVTTGLGGALPCFAGSSAGRDPSGSASIQKNRSPLAFDQIRLSGWLGERINRAQAGMDDLSENTWWNVVGQWGFTLPGVWLRNSLLFARYTGRLHPLIEETRNRLVEVATQPKHEIDYAKNRIGVYLDGEVITGLLAYADFFKDPATLEAAAIKGRYIAANHTKTTHYYKGIAIERLSHLSDSTGDHRFRDVAVAIAGEIGLGFLRLREGVHGAAASMVLDSYLALHEALGERQYLDWALEGWRAIRERMSITGGIGEVLYFSRPADESTLHTETCQTSWWLIFNLHLARVTGDMTYVDLAERILLNELLAQQLHRTEGPGFCALGDVDQGFRGDHNYFCCDAEGTFGLLNVLGNIYTREGFAALDVNLFANSDVRLPLADSSVVEVEQKTEYPETGLVTLSFLEVPPGDFTIRLRVPSGAGLASVRVGGQSLSFEVQNSSLAVRRQWRRGETLEVLFALPMRIEADRSGEGPRIGAVQLHRQEIKAKRLGVIYGPTVSAIFRTGHHNDPSWIWNADYPEVLDCGGSVFEGYPGSKSEILELESQTYQSGSVAELTKAEDTNQVPSIMWTARLGPQVTIERQVRVLPGLPLSLEYTDVIRGWDGAGRLLVGGLRFAVVKSNLNPSYGQRRVAWPYPFPVFSSKPDLRNCDDLVYQAGTFGLYETLEDGKELPKTGVFVLNNGFFSAVSLYDPGPVKRVICRRTEAWVGVYLEPVTAPEVVMARRWFFPLIHKPASQSTIRSRAERSLQVQSEWKPGEANSLELVLSGPSQSGAVIKVPKHPRVTPGMVIANDRCASYLLDQGDAHFIVRADVPGIYRLRV